MRCIIICYSLLTLLSFANAMTRAQLKKTMSVVKKQCIPKTGVTEDKIGKIEQGVFNEEKNVMCFMACVYKSMNVVKGDRFDMDAVAKQVDILYPQDMKGPVRAAIDKCFHIQDGYEEVCERVFFSAKCLYEKDPANWVFP